MSIILQYSDSWLNRIFSYNYLNGTIWNSVFMYISLYIKPKHFLHMSTQEAIFSGILFSQSNAVDLPTYCYVILDAFCIQDFVHLKCSASKLALLEVLFSVCFSLYLVSIILLYCGIAFEMCIHTPSK